MKDIDKLIAPMMECEQTKGQSVYQHGLSVHSHLKELKEMLRSGEHLDKWRVPTQVLEKSQEILDNIHDDETLYMYTVFHDCGKPQCREVDAGGRVHFPNHAEVSKRVFLQHSNNQIVANLIGWDMVIHTSSADEINEMLEKHWTKKDAYTLILSSLSEVHSNANMFGGIESTSFKSKYKKIQRRCNQILKFYGEEK